MLGRVSEKNRKHTVLKIRFRRVCVVVTIKPERPRHGQGGCGDLFVWRGGSGDLLV